MRRFVCMATAVVLAAAAAWSAPPGTAAPRTRAEVVAAALVTNPGLLTLREAIAELKGDSPSLMLLDQSKLTLSGSWTQNPKGSNPGGSASVTMPIIAQASVGGSFDFAKSTGSLNLTVQPFAKGEDAETWRENLAAKELEYRQETAKVRSSAESFYVSMAAALARLDIAKSRFAIAEAAYKGAALKYEAGLLAYKDYKQNVQEYQAQLQAVLKAEKDLINLKKNALDIFGGVAILESAADWSTTAEELIQASEELETALKAANDPSSAELTQLDYALSALEREQAATLIWQPSLNLGASSNTAFDTFGATLGFTFSLDQIKADAKAKLAVQIDTKKQELIRKKLDLDYSVRQAQIQCETLREGLAIQRTAVRLTEGAYEEAKVQLAAGAIDPDDLESARLDMKEASLSLTGAAADLLSSWRSLQIYYLNHFTMEENNHE